MFRVYGYEKILTNRSCGSGEEIRRQKAAGNGFRRKSRMTGQDGNIVLCGSNSYEKKYYFNEEFDSLPEAVKKQ
ncbi:MAG: hypothetical protein EGP94_15070, partial [Lachnospiraceae bacterium]|nr:hypothetical protein [Lachnospiraceae bacterium]